MDFVLQKADTALENGTLLQERYQILQIVSMDELGITYEASAEEQRFSVREYCPMAFAVREDATLEYDEDENGDAFRDGGRQFVKIGKLLCKGLPHFVQALELFNENNTSYIVSPLPEGTHPNDRTFTPAEVQQLGVALCDSYAALHKAKLYYGAIRSEHLLLEQDGSPLLRSEQIQAEGSAVEDLHCLTAFLSSLLPELDTEDDIDTLLRNALQFRYQDAAALKAALLGEQHKRAAVKSAFGVFRLALCLICLAVAIFSIRTAPDETLSLSEALDSGRITPEVIPVWLPLAEDADERTVCAMYERLAAGFEQQNPGCGVDIRIYADGSFSDALSLLEQNGKTPVVFMDTQEVSDRAADLSSIAESLKDIYLTDLHQFTTSIPLGCSIPVLFCNAHWNETYPDTIAFDELPADTLYDESADAFIDAQNADQKTALYFEAFLDEGEHPVLASSSCMALAEHSGISSGAVQMIPVSVSNQIPLQYEMFCSINQDSDPNSQRVGMLWLQYLLTEEAQQILFVENYGNLPLHQKAFESAVDIHSGLSALSVLGAAASETQPDTEVNPS